MPWSTVAPHFIDATGEVWERRNGQTRRASAQRVRELSLSGGHDPADASARLDSYSAAVGLAVALDAPRKSSAMHARSLACIARIALEPSEAFRDWVYSREALDKSHAFAWSMARSLNDRDWMTPSEPAPARTTAGGHVASGAWDGRLVREIAVAWDRIGVGGVRLAGERPDDSGVFYLLSNQVRDQWLVPSLEYLLDCTSAAGAYGGAVLRWDLYGVRGADVTTVRNGNVVAAHGVIPQHYENMVAVELNIEVPDADATGTAHSLWQQLERLAGAQQ